jgi:hypothetical protein
LPIHAYPCELCTLSLLFSLLRTLLSKLMFMSRVRPSLNSII